ncbi:MAG: hypothetical protein V4671_03725, partial [Armatimonadota bacterium]
MAINDPRQNRKPLPAPPSETPLSGTEDEASVLQTPLRPDAPTPLPPGPAANASSNGNGAGAGGTPEEPGRKRRRRRRAGGDAPQKSGGFSV